eukprot:1875296-Rhodomonas_salina.2
MRSSIGFVSTARFLRSQYLGYLAGKEKDRVPSGLREGYLADIGRVPKSARYPIPGRAPCRIAVAPYRRSLPEST